MTVNGWIQIALFCAVVLALVRPLGSYMTRVFSGERTFLSPVLEPIERGLYRVAGIDRAHEQHWLAYATAMLVFHAGGFVLLYALLRLQTALPLNPDGQGCRGPGPRLQHRGELRHQHQLAVLRRRDDALVPVADAGPDPPELPVGRDRHRAGRRPRPRVSRGRRRGRSGRTGSMSPAAPSTCCCRSAPCSRCSWSGRAFPQTLGGAVEATTLEGARQTIAVGPVASQVAIKMLGTNGGGFFNANAAHPFENPTALSNFVQMVSIFAIGAALTNLFGRSVGDERQGWAILAAMAVLFLAGIAIAYGAESAGSPVLNALGLPGGNMEGKEIRFGIVASALFAVVTTAASCGAVNAMHDSFTALGGMIPLINMELGEIIVGGVGAGLYGMLVFVIVTIFVAGLMVGRTPEYLGKKIEAREVKMAMLAILCLPLVMLGGTALATVVAAGLAGPANAGPHGFSEILYAFTSAAANNGSAFGGLTANTTFYNATLAAGMLVGRFFVIVPALAIAGALAAKKTVPASSGTFPTDGGLFVGLLVGVILIVGGLTFFPALALGPIVEHLAGGLGQTFAAGG